MKRFTEYLSEDVLPTANVQDGNFDIENDAVRSQVNGTLAAVVAQPAVTPYVLLHRISKALSYFSIILPKRTFLEGTKGVEVYEIMQFGDRMGMTDQGEFVTRVPTKFYLFFQYGIAHPFNVTYTKPNIDGMYRAMAKIVDQAELDKLLNAAEAMMAESCDDKATMSQRKAGREEIQTNGNHGTPSTDKAMDTSGEKSAKVDKVWPAVVKEEEQIDEASYDKLDKYVRSAHVSGTGAAARGEIAMHRGQKTRLHRANKTGEKREQGINLALDKMAGRALVPATRKEKMEEEYEKVEAGVKKRPGETHTLHRRNPGHKTEYHTITTDRDGRKSVKSGSPKYIKKHWDKLEEASDKDRALSKLASDAVSKGHPVKKLPAGRAQYSVLPKPTVKGNIERGRWSGHGKFGIGEERIDEKLNKSMPAGDVISDFVHSKSKTFKDDTKKERISRALGAYYGMHPEKSKKMEEGMAPVKKSYGMRKMKKKVSTQVKQGLGVEKGDDKTILVTNKGDKAALRGGGVHRIPKKKFNPLIHNRASE